jgi:rubredoxin
MGKKTEEAEVKKECPSCGLGVALDSTICEFCGWDFEEEDEWILQIEKLERDLMLEKQKFAPGTVNAKIESTIHTPVYERTEVVKAPPPLPTREPPPKEAPAAPVTKEPRFAPSPVRQPLESAPEPVPPAPEKVRRVRSVKVSAEELEAKPAPAPSKVRKVRSVKRTEP